MRQSHLCAKLSESASTQRPRQHTHSHTFSSALSVSLSLSLSFPWHVPFLSSCLFFQLTLRQLLFTPFEAVWYLFIYLFLLQHSSLICMSKAYDFLWSPLTIKHRWPECVSYVFCRPLICHSFTFYCPLHVRTIHDHGYRLWFKQSFKKKGKSQMCPAGGLNVRWSVILSNGW